MSRTYNADSFRNWLDAESQRVSKAFKTVEHIQADYQGAYTRFRAEHDKTLSQLTDELGSMARAALPSELDAAIEKRVPEEAKAIETRVAALNQEIATAEKQADALLAESQNKIAELRALNPKLDEREERLKSQLASLQTQLDALNRQVSERARGIGFVLNAWKIQELDRQRYRVVGSMQTASSELHEVRQEWKDKRSTVEQQEQDFKNKWIRSQSRLGELRRERDDLAQNGDARAKERAVRYVLDNLKTPVQTNDPALTEKLNRMVALNVQTDDFTSALGSVAGILGIATGVNEGLKRLRESVTAIINEQQRHSAYLAPLSLEVDDSVLAFGKVWDDLMAKAQDEKAMAGHPTAFIAAMQPFLEERLTQDRITGYFNGLAQVLQRATGRWRGK